MELRRKLGVQATQKVEATLVDDLAQVSSRQLNIYTDGLEFVEMLLAAIRAHHDELLAKAKAEGRVHSHKEMVSPKEFMHLAYAIRSLVDGQRVILDLLTKVTQSAAEVRMMEDFSKMSKEELQEILSIDASLPS